MPRTIAHAYPDVLPDARATQGQRPKRNPCTQAAMLGAVPGLVAGASLGAQQIVDSAACYDGLPTSAKSVTRSVAAIGKMWGAKTFGKALSATGRALSRVAPPLVYVLRWPDKMVDLAVGTGAALQQHSWQGETEFITRRPGTPYPPRCLAQMPPPVECPDLLSYQQADRIAPVWYAADYVVLGTMVGALLVASLVYAIPHWVVRVDLDAHEWLLPSRQGRQFARSLRRLAQDQMAHRQRSVRAGSAALGDAAPRRVSPPAATAIEMPRMEPAGTRDERTPLLGESRAPTSRSL